LARCAAGIYCDESFENTTGQTFLRGYRITDSSGAVTIKTIVPGWYSARIIPIYVMVRTLSWSGSVLTEFTTRFFFRADADHFSVSSYRLHTLPGTSNAEDSIYPSSTRLTLAKAATGGVTLRP